MSELKAWRDANKISQKALADRVRSTQPHLSAIENGEENASLELSVRIFKETGVCVGKLRNATARQAKVIADISSVQ